MKMTDRNMDTKALVTDGICRIRHGLFTALLRRPTSARYSRIHKVIAWFKEKYGTDENMSNWAQLFAIESMLFDVSLNMEYRGTRYVGNHRESTVVYKEYV